MAPPSSSLLNSASPGGSGRHHPEDPPPHLHPQPQQPNHNHHDSIVITQATTRKQPRESSTNSSPRLNPSDEGGDDGRAGGGENLRTRHDPKKPRLLLDEMPPPVRLALSQHRSEGFPKSIVCHKGSRRTNDEIHSTIRLCPITCLIMDTPEFQRLKGIKQLGSADFVYMNCNTTRFEHSVGVSALAHRIVSHVVETQPQLNVNSKDVLCVKLAGLLHDVGHGPFSHVYEQFQQYLTDHLKDEEERVGGSDDEKANGGHHPYEDTIHPLDVPYRGHESVSLLVIRHIFERTLGLALNWNDLDAPLLLLPPQSLERTIQHNSAAAAKKMGGATIDLHLEDDDFDDDYEGDYILRGSSSIHPHPVAASAPSSSQPIDDATEEASLTTRDVLFIMECIWGKPIDEYEALLGPGFHGRPRHKEWLYDVVCNRHSGLDVDKIDYYARDERRAFKGAGEIDVPMIEEAVVAWAECSNPAACHKCRYRMTEATATAGTHPRHLMICYPEKHIPTCMDFFKKRFELHTKIYSHKTSVGTSYLICDVLRAADPHFRLPVLRSDRDARNEVIGSAKREYSSLPISRAFVDPDVFLRCRDSVLDQIANTTDPNLAEARRLIARLWSRDIYKCAIFKVLNMQTEWNLWELSEKDIVDGMLQVRGVHRDESTGAVLELERRDILVHKCNIHHGSKDDNPLLQMRFVEKDQLHKLAWPLQLLPEATAIQEARYAARLPRQFAERSLRIYSRDSAKEPLVRHVFEQWYAEFLGEMELTPSGMDASAFGVNPDAQRGTENAGHVAFFCSQESIDDDDDNKDENDYSGLDDEDAGRAELDLSNTPRRGPGGTGGGGLGQVTPVRRV